MAYNSLALYAVIEAIVSILILFGGLVYLWRKGALEWMQVERVLAARQREKSQ